MKKQNKIQQRVFFILLGLGLVGGLGYASYRFWIGQKLPCHSINVSAYKICNPIFRAVPNEEALENEDRYSPLISEYLTSFEDINFDGDQKSNKYSSISPRTQPWGKFIPKMSSTADGGRTDFNINLGKILIREIKLGNSGSISFDLGAQKNIKLNNPREVSMELGDPKFLRQLAPLKQTEAHRIYFIDRMYLADVDYNVKAGISATYNNQTSNLAELEVELQDYYKGFSLVLGCDFMEVNSSGYLQNRKFSGTTQEQWAYDLRSVAGISRDKANTLSKEPVKWFPLKEKKIVKIEFIRPFGGNVEHQAIQIDLGEEGQKEINSNSVNLKPGRYTLSYVVFNGPLVYYVGNSITINSDLSVQIDNTLYDLGIIEWKRFNVLNEYKKRNQEKTAQNIDNINLLRKNIFQAAVKKSSPFNIDSNNSQDLKALVSTGAANNLQTILDNIPSDNQLLEEQLLRKNLAEYWLAYLNDNQLPPENEIQKYENYRQEYAEIKWIQAHHKLNLANLDPDPDSDQFVEVAKLFSEVAKNLTKPTSIEQQNDQALIAYINAATIEASKSADKYQAVEENLNVVLEDEQKAEDLKNIMFETVKDLVSKDFIDINIAFQAAQKPSATAKDIVDTLNIIFKDAKERGKNAEDILNVILDAAQEHGTESKEIMINTINHFKIALEHQKKAQDINRTARKLFGAATRLPRTWLDWLGNINPSSDTPNLWQKTVYRNPDGVNFKVTEQNTGYVEANNGSIQVSTLVNVDLNERKYLAWDWKAIELPPKGDLRKDETDDQAIQVVVVFELPGLQGSKALNYVWDTNAPIGTKHKRMVGFPGAQYELSYLVVESGVVDSEGNDKRNKWQSVRRNLIEDFREVFPGERDPTHIQSVTVQTNSWRTNTKSAGEVGQIRFTKELLSEEEILH